jgi:hypothetical protein
MLAAGVGGLVEEMVFARWLVEINADPVQVHLQLGVTIVVRYQVCQNWRSEDDHSFLM